MNFKIVFPAGYDIVDIYNDNIDIHVVLDDNKVYFGTVFTLANIRDLMDKDQSEFFWATDMVIVRSLSKENLYLAITDLIAAGYLGISCSEIGTVASVYSKWQTFEEIPV